MEKIRIGVVGYGNRGSGVTESVLFKHPSIEVVAICDTYTDRAEKGGAATQERYGNSPLVTTDYKELLSSERVDAVYIACSWEYHVRVAIEAMKQGKAAAMEVGGAYSIEELNDLVATYEKTKTPFMFMENCCYFKDELFATALVRSGKLGEIVHCSGAYAHDLRYEVSEGNINRHYRLRNYANRNTENYPTHELGPIAKILGINRGNRIVSLVSVASKARGLEQYISDHPELTEKDPTLKGRRFAQGDIVTTILTCAGGETIMLKLDTTLPRSYSRELTVRGTKGYYNQDNDQVFTDGMEELFEPAEFNKRNNSNAKDYYDEYLPPVWKNMTKEQIESGHGGMDYILWCAFVDALREGKEMPIDVYDAATWMAVTVLSERSVAQGGAPQAMPDFTNGEWLLRKGGDVVDFGYLNGGKTE